jgi:hypothetical protein
MHKAAKTADLRAQAEVVAARTSSLALKTAHSAPSNAFNSYLLALLEPDTIDAAQVHIARLIKPL